MAYIWGMVLHMLILFVTIFTNLMLKLGQDKYKSRYNLKILKLSTIDQSFQKVRNFKIPLLATSIKQVIDKYSLHNL